ncbi:response regulator transcription factor [Streptomyces sp. NBC_01808]|uniref:response regulator transcription factor n=1 Tax=Streptomyces sp. NBC_01808 TaxID=2975947 RepID=UPI002DD843FE|nr:response regulator transcription factor [Streptomyces sp. NBC_01808]WSA40664.1 response regulator transcription factor [Streptomyces sp. NBC_01808]
MTPDRRHLSHVLGLALDRFHIDIVLTSTVVADAVSRPEAGRVDVWLARPAAATGESVREFRRLVPPRGTAEYGAEDGGGAGAGGGVGRPRPLAVVCGGEEGQVAQALALGASAVMLPDDSVFDTAAGLYAAASRDLFVSPRLLRRVSRRLSDALSGPLTVGVDVLTEREQRVLSLMSAGMSNGAIARSLCISPATVSTHVGHILRKLGAGNRTQAVIAALQQSLIAHPAHRA